VHDIGLEVGFETLKGLPVLAAKKLVLNVSEDLLGGAIVDAVAFTRHTLDKTVLSEHTDVNLVLILPAHIRVQNRLSSLGFGIHEYLKHLLLLGKIRAHRDGVGNNLLAGKVINRSEVGLTKGKLKLGNISTQLLPGTGRREVATDDVGEPLPHIPLIGVIPTVGPLTAYTAAQPHLAHHLQDRLIGNAHPFLSAQAHGYLPVTAPVGGSRKDLGDLGT